VAPAKAAVAVSATSAARGKAARIATFYTPELPRVPSGLTLPPVPKRLDERVARLGRQILFPQHAGEVDRPAHLSEVGRTALAHVEVLLEPLSVARIERSLEIVRDELDHLGAGEFHGQTKFVWRERKTLQVRGRWPAGRCEN